MAPKGANSKKESGRAKKAENEAKKQEAATAERVRQISRASTPAAESLIWMYLAGTEGSG